MRSVVAEDFDTIHYFGNLSPWRPISSSNYGLPEASHVIPDGCQTVQVHLLHRHGLVLENDLADRYPDSI